MIKLPMGFSIAFSNVHSVLRSEPFNWALIPALDPSTTCSFTQNRRCGSFSSPSCPPTQTPLWNKCKFLTAWTQGIISPTKSPSPWFLNWLVLETSFSFSLAHLCRCLLFPPGWQVCPVPDPMYVYYSEYYPASWVQRPRMQGIHLEVGTGGGWSIHGEC